MNNSLVLSILRKLPCCPCSQARPAQGLASTADFAGTTEDETPPLGMSCSTTTNNTASLVELPEIQVTPLPPSSPTRGGARGYSNATSGNTNSLSSSLSSSATRGFNATVTSKRDEPEEGEEDEEDEDGEDVREEPPPPPPPPQSKKNNNASPSSPQQPPSPEKALKAPPLALDTTTRTPPLSPKVQSPLASAAGGGASPRHPNNEEDADPSNVQETTAKNFITALEQGIVVIKHDRKGRSRLRELYCSDGGVSFSWREPSKKGHEKKLSGGARSRVDYAFDQVIEIRRGTVPDPSGNPGETGTATLRASCEEKDLHKSFSLILTDRSVDLTCHSIEQMTFLLKGFTAVTAQRKAIAKRKLAAVY